MLAFAALVLCAFWRLSSAAVSVCPSDDGTGQWRMVGDRCFFLTATVHSFETCMRHVCGPRGATLACIDEDNFAALNLHNFENFGSKLNHTHGRSGFSRAAWIGYSNAAADGQWRWLNGCQSNWQKWKPGQPNGQCGGERCGLLGPRGYLLDSSCRMRHPCLCEFPGTPTQAFEDSVPLMRTDTCYSRCSDGTEVGGGWCQAWPFHKTGTFVHATCQWEREAATGDASALGTGLRECVARVKSNKDCGTFFSYAAGHCDCSAQSGPDPTCSRRDYEEIFDTFSFNGTHGVQLVATGERCASALNLDNFRGTVGALQLDVEIGQASSRIWIVGLGLCTLIAAATFSQLPAACGAAEKRPCPSFVQQTIMNVGDYGELLRNGTSTRASATVNQWMQISAVSTVAYGLGLMGFGLARASANYSLHISFTSTLLMVVSSALVGTGTLVVHGRLAGAARRISGPWLHVLAITKFLMALFALSYFITVVDYIEDCPSAKGVCLASYSTLWARWLALPCHCLSAIALWMVRQRAGVEANFASLVLVAGSIGAGVGMWASGWADAADHFNFAGLFLVLGAVSYLISGAALEAVNKDVKDFGAVEVTDDCEAISRHLKVDGTPQRRSSPKAAGQDGDRCYNFCMD